MGRKETVKIVLRHRISREIVLRYLVPSIVGMFVNGLLILLIDGIMVGK